MPGLWVRFAFGASPAALLLLLLLPASAAAPPPPPPPANAVRFFVARAVLATASASSLANLALVTLISASYALNSVLLAHPFARE